MAIINERKIRLVENGVLSADAIRAYLENRLSEEERTEFEHVIANNSFAAEAVEGIQNAGNFTGSFASLDVLAEYVRERSGTNKKATDTLTSAIQINWMFLAAAVAVIGIIVAVGVIISHQSSASKDEMPTEVAETQSPVADSVNLATVNVPTDSVISQVEISARDTVKTVVEVPKNPVQVQPTVVKKVVAADTVDAMALFNEGNYIDAEKKFDKIILVSPNNYEAHYFSAVSAYINGNTGKAEKQFDYMLDNGLYIEGSKWYKANILLKKGDTASAKEILRSLSISTGMYKERAIKKLESLN